MVWNGTKILIWNMDGLRLLCMGRLGAADYAPGLLGARGEKKFYVKKKYFFQKKNFFCLK